MLNYVNNMEYSIHNDQAPHERSKTRQIPIKLVIILLVLVLVVTIGSLFWFNCRFLVQCKTPANLSINGAIIKKNEMIAKITAQLIKSHIDGLLVVGSFYSGKKEVVQNIQQGKWQNAMNFVAGAFSEDNLGAIDRMALFDITGTTMANLPEQGHLIGQNFAYRDWYQGVTADFKPYASEVYVRATKPPANVIGVAFPVKNNNNVPIAILLFTIKTDSFLWWLEEIKIGESGKTFVVDKRGHVIAHPDIASQGEPVDYSYRTDVQKVISGQSGTEITFNLKNEQILSSYEPIPEYRWGVITKIKLAEVIKSGFGKEIQGEWKLSNIWR